MSYESWYTDKIASLENTLALALTTIKENDETIRRLRADLDVANHRLLIDGHEIEALRYQLREIQTFGY